MRRLLLCLMGWWDEAVDAALRSLPRPGRGRSSRALQEIVMNDHIIPIDHLCDDLNRRPERVEFGANHQEVSIATPAEDCVLILKAGLDRTHYVESCHRPNVPAGISEGMAGVLVLAVVFVLGLAMTALLCGWVFLPVGVRSWG